MVLLRPKILKDYNFVAPRLCQATGQLHFAGFYWAITICRVLLCVELLGNYNL